LRVPFNVTIDFVADTFNLSPDLAQFQYGAGVVVVILLSELVDQRDDDRERPRDDRDDD